MPAQKRRRPKDFRKESIMSTLRNSVATATSLVAVLCAGTAFAQETTTTTTTPTTTQPVQAPPAQQPVQSVTVQQPVVEPVQPASTTRTTAAPYTVTGADTETERTVNRRPNRTLLSTGTGIFVLSYGSSVIAGAVSDRDSDKKLFIPVVGPWMDLADRSCTGANPCGNNEDVAKAMIITSGVVQGAGVLMALSSLIIPESTSITERTRTAKLTKPEVHVLPVSFAAGAGVGAVGRF
jgi:hypothetical protein